MKKIITAIACCFLIYSCSSDDKVADSAEVKVIPQQDTVIDKQKLIEQIKAEAKPAYVQAQKEVYTINQYISLADSGLMNKKQVVNEFNKTVGQVVGNLNSFEKVKARIKETGDAYVEYIFNKACADIANQKAAEEKFKTEQLKK